MGVLLAIDRPGLAAALAERGHATTLLRDRHAAACLAHGYALCVADRWLAVPTRLLVLAGEDVALAALEAGAEDAFPSSAGDALIATRIARLLGREISRIGDVTLDLAARRATRAGRVVPLLPREFALLRRLAAAGGQTVTHADLLAAVWGMDFDPGTNVIAVHVSRLRAKLHAGGPPVLLTDKGRGYRLVAASPIEAHRAAV